MRGDFDEDELDDEYSGYPYDDEEPYCHRCDNKGTIIVCIDDMCRGARASACTATAKSSARTVKARVVISNNEGSR